MLYETGTDRAANIWVKPALSFRFPLRADSLPKGGATVTSGFWGGLSAYLCAICIGGLSVASAIESRAR